uniref:Carboxylesterase type B domain-containing protein n=1 Tax=Phlebotomus papatasi TaxID=29031 RepID=A0A1B0GQ68_PHLPP
MRAPVGPISARLAGGPLWQLLGLLFITLALLDQGTARELWKPNQALFVGVILELNSKHLEPVEVFKSVPYAAAPIGSYRFAPPRKLIPWTGTKLADTFSPVCPQNYPDVANRSAALMSMPKGRYQYLKKVIPLLVNQSEDCLTLNIYVPGSGE